MKKVLGRFYFKRTSSGNLLGEFSNNHSSTSRTESADAIDFSDSFPGTYNSTWFEDDTAKSAILTIELKKSDIRDIYIVNWSSGSQLIYWGEGMLVDDCLIGDYRNFDF